MRPWTLCVVALLLGACSDDEVDPQPDGGSSCKNPALAALSKSEKTWKGLAADGGDAYWYERENCVVNSPKGEIFVVQVEGGKAREVSSSSIERDACEVTLNAYADFGASSFEQLYAKCRALLERECTASFATDERGVLRTCRWEDETNCFDNCGEGVHIRRWEFGQSP